MVAKDGVLVSVELSGGHLGGGGHACGIGDTLPEKYDQAHRGKGEKVIIFTRDSIYI